MENAKKSVTTNDFKCDNCGKISDIDQISESVATYGFVYLVGKENSWLGFNCPLCEKHWLNIKRFKNEGLKPFIREVRYETTEIFGKLAYYSFPFNFLNPLTKEPSSLIEFMMPMDNGLREVQAEELDPGNEILPILLETSYLSYVIGSLAMGPVISICGYKDEEIKKFAACESDTGVKVFPRYIVYEPLYTEIENLCWEYQLYIEYFRSLGSAFTLALKNISPSPKKSISKSFYFMHVLDWPPDSVGPGYMKKKDQWILSHTTVLDSENKILGEEPNEELLGLLGDDHEKFSETIWSNFFKNYVQDLLGKLADKFIYEYIELSKRMDLTPKKAWNLKEKYLLDLAGAIDSRTKRDKLKKNTKEHERKLVEEAEKHFPSVKILSDNSQINETKIWISNLSKVDASIMSNLTILLLGERGTGKDLFAKAIHDASGRKGEFVRFDCSAVTESIFGSELFGHSKGAFTGADQDKKGALEAAVNGTLFIDEVGNLPTNLQSKFLGVLQNREFQPLGSGKTIPVDALVVLATNKDLDAMTEKNEFMPDLYDRFKRPAYTIPPLKERKEDLPLLIDHFIDNFDQSRKDDPALDKLTITSDCLEHLAEYDWPGNVRDLENVIREIIIKRIMYDDRSPIDLLDLPDLTISEANSKSKGPKKPKNLPGNTRVTDDQIRHWMKELGGNKTQVGKKLGVSYHTILRRCKNLGL